MKNFLKSNVVIISTSLFLTLVFTGIIIFQFQLDTKLTDLNAKFTHLVAEIKTNETRVKEINRIQQIEKIQEIKKIEEMKEKLGVIEKKVQMASDIVNVFNKLKLNIQITSDPNAWQMESDTLTVTYVVHNFGKLNCFIEPGIIITTKNAAEENVPLVEGVDYLFEKRDFPIFTLSAGEKLVYKEMIIFNRKRLSTICQNAADRICIQALFRVKTNPALLSSLPPFLREILGEEELSKLFEVEVMKENFVLPFL